MRASKVILIGLMVAIFIAGSFFLPVRPWFAYFENYVQTLGVLGPVVIAAVYVLCTVLLIPGSAISVGAGTLFGLKTGFFVVFAGANLGALCSFLLARGFLREKVAAWAKATPKFQSLDRAIGKRGFHMVFLTRLSPLFPFVWLNYFLGLTAVRTGDYALANLIGMLPGTFLYVYIGAAARDAIASNPEASSHFYRQVLMYAGLAATLAVVIFVTRMARKALREAEQAEEGVALLNAQHRPISFEQMTLAHDAHDRQLIENCRAPGRTNPQPGEKYNLVVIGGGTAGLVSAAGAAGLGAKVALIERNLLGGDCLNVGCVPSKSILRAARAVYDAENVARFGITLAAKPEINFRVTMERMRKLRAELSRHDSIERFTKLGVDVFIGDGKFVGPNEIGVGGKVLRFDRAVITTGGRAKIPPIGGLSETGFYTNETIFTLTELPRRLAVIGAGPIGCEMAQAFQRFGSSVTLITDGGDILPKEDRDAAEILYRQLEKDGVRIITGGKIQRAETQNNEKQLALVVNDKAVVVG
ncbi:MAG: FAD-dependent oxidoreductase, partial [Candidatus Binatia bacterium]